jgi:hypothetical protein
MKSRQTFTVRLLLSTLVMLGFRAPVCADDPESASQLTLVDLAHYRAALSGRAFADDAKPGDPATKMSFKDLWENTDTILGRRVTVAGRVERIFRQGPLGSFPALAEVWIASPAGDPFCLIVPQESNSAHSSRLGDRLQQNETSKSIPGHGQSVRFTGIFLKMLRYRASDGARLAPLLVGDQPPVSVRELNQKAIPASSRNGEPASTASQVVGSLAHRVRSLVTYALSVVVLSSVGALLTWRHFRVSSRSVIHHNRRTVITSLAPDSALEFVRHRREP